ncbi:hypothetical protein ACFFSW_22225 [Saccharothrix longispora]|uniref:Allene oxide cyclase barrel-like domain-containing protein n=1 Tax=Saccharothrix longispora TaxID=33920 RepID=A0ABU1PR66_9PSEU|nr:hypothetical protein [Saccharothrix longispora]MDR6593118.1 hypothetical protein [Saccharothrix longispora]
MQVQPWLVVALTGALVGAGAAADTGGREATVEVLSKRTLMSAAVNPVVGSGFVSGGELFDAQGARVGDGFSHCGVVAVSVAVPPAVTTHCTSVFRLGDEELHLSGRRHYRSIAAGFDDTAVAVTGGTGAYANARGEGRAVRAGSGAEVGYRFTFTLVTD